MIIYQDDILIGATSINELQQKTQQVINKLREAGMSVNRDKCKFNCEEKNYLGFQISKEGISPDPNLLIKISQVASLANKKELESFLGLANFYSRYVPKYSNLTEAFADLRRKNSSLFGHINKKRLLTK